MTQPIELQELLMSRKSIRKYKPMISVQYIEELLESAFHAPTTGNMQLYSVIINQDEKMKELLAPTHFNQGAFREAPVTLTFCADYNRFIKWCEYRNAKPGYDNFLSFINAASDALLFTQTLCNLAEEEGLGCCYLGTTVYMPQTIIDTLRLPQLVMPVATITLGWPDENPPLTDRLPVDAFVHQETYGDYTPERINLFYAEKEQLEENQHFVSINKKKTLAQVFTDCRYTKTDNEAMSAGLLETLKRQGFLPKETTL